MSLTFIYEASLGALFPGVAAMVAALEAEIAASLALSAEIDLELPELQASLDVSASIAAGVQANLSIDPSLSLAAALAYSGDAALALSAGTPQVALNAELTAQLAIETDKAITLSAKLAAKVSALAAINARITTMRLALPDLLPRAYLYRYDGPAGDLLGAGVDPLVANQQTTALLVVTTNTAALEALAKLAKMTP